MDTHQDPNPLSNETLRLIGEAYGSLDEPDFSFVQEAIDSRPYDNVIREVSATLGVTCEEYDDPNDDVSFQYHLSRGDENWALELSMVGPFAVVARIEVEGGWESILSQNDPSLSEPEHQLLAILCSHGLQLLSKELLEQLIPLRLFNTNPDRVRVYQALFSDIDVLPWRQQSSSQELS